MRITLTLISILFAFGNQGRPGSVNGTLTLLGSGEPIRGATVTLIKIVPGELAVRGAEPVFATALSNAAGTFRFLDIPPGDYLIRPATSRHLLVGGPLGFRITDGEHRDVYATMRSAGAISGRVLDETFRPIANAAVEAMAELRAGWMNKVAVAATGKTNAEGRFAIDTLRDGKYYLRVIPENSLPGGKNYPVTYYPNALDAAHAEVLTISNAIDNPNFEMRLEPGGVNLSGRFVPHDVLRYRDSLVIMRRSQTIPIEPRPVQNLTDRGSDRFEVRAITPGSYYLYAIGETRGQAKSSQWIRIPVEVGSAEVDNLVINELPTGSIKGRVVISSDSVAPQEMDFSPFELTVLFAEFTPIQVERFSALPDWKGEFQFNNISEMLLFFREPQWNDDWFVSEMLLDGRDVMATGFYATPGKESVLDIVISNQGGRVSGVIKNSKGEPIPAARFALLPDEPYSSNPMLMKNGVANGDGTFTIDSLRPGRYVLIGFPDEDRFTPDVMRNREFVRKFDRFGYSLSVAPGPATRVEVIAAPIEP